MPFKSAHTFTTVDKKEDKKEEKERIRLAYSEKSKTRCSLVQGDRNLAKREGYQGTLVDS